MSRSRYMAFKGGDAYRGWARRLSAHCRMPLALVLERALQAQARAEGFPEPPPPRIERAGVSTVDSGDRPS